MYGGGPDSAKAAFAAGILDEITAGDLRESAVAFAAAKAVAGRIHRTRDIAFSAEQSRAGLEACAKLAPR